MVEGIGDALGRAMTVMLLCCVVFVPLGMWKLVELIIWCVKHIRVIHPTVS